MTVLEKLEETRLYFDNPERWLQGSSSSVGMKSMCLWRRIDCVKTIKTVYSVLPFRFRFLSLFSDNGMPKEGAVIMFNDHPKTNHKDIIRVLDKAIKKAKRRN